MSISIQDAVQTLREESSRNHIAMLNEIKILSNQVSGSLSADSKKKLPLLQDELFHKMDRPTRSIETLTLQSSPNTSQSIMTEMDQTLPTLEVRVARLIVEQMEKSTFSINSAVTNSSADLKSALDTYVKQQTTVIDSILQGNPEAKKIINVQLLCMELANCGPSFFPCKIIICSAKYHLIVCQPDIGRQDSFLSRRSWGVRVDLTRDSRSWATCTYGMRSSYRAVCTVMKNRLMDD
jgi:hypothetical protein